jgi:hypothetical protein
VARPRIAPAEEVEMTDTQAIESRRRYEAEIEDSIKAAKERGLRHD